MNLKSASHLLDGLGEEKFAYCVKLIITSIVE